MVAKDYPASERLHPETRQGCLLDRVSSHSVGPTPTNTLVSRDLLLGPWGPLGMPSLVRGHGHDGYEHGGHGHDEIFFRGKYFSGVNIFQ